MAEVYAKEPHPAYEERVWRCLDYVFELPPAMTIIDKAKYIINGIRDRTLVYQSIRRMRAPTDMEQPTGPHSHTTAINHAARIWYPQMAKSTRARTGSPGTDPANPMNTTGMHGPYGQMNNPNMPANPHASSAPASTHVSPNLQHAPNPYANATTPPSNYDMGAPDDGSRHQAYHTAPNPMATSTQHSLPNIFNRSPGDSGSMGSGGVGGSPGDEAMLEIDWVSFHSPYSYMTIADTQQNEWDKLFPSQLANGNPADMYIPDFSYPPVDDRTGQGQQSASGSNPSMGGLPWGHVGPGQPRQH